MTALTYLLSAAGLRASTLLEVNWFLAIDSVVWP